MTDLDYSLSCTLREGSSRAAAQPIHGKGNMREPTKTSRQNFGIMTLGTKHKNRPYTFFNKDETTSDSMQSKAIRFALRISEEI